ncbi:hypothetical protein CWR48_03890 [Oceanobacillus arenosus]|uniref:Activator of Hsp90 ATPase homologue 1/2-like C-terminal domain-containing protein n=1 Tax=Oceanobacillus arenosus TaxID=1229153 RepID=A0A3D8PY71_9BACI|nr:SRPBCC domain-containing protein [Oceanobacillus arenosus]RDW21106.1 hypothetical protein CWR48_03890 [Oceanobacillus arenosus]
MIWDAITNEKKLQQWYALGSPWEIPHLKEGEKITFTLMPSVHNNLSESYPMSMTIHAVTPYKEFSVYLDEQQFLLTFHLHSEKDGISVTINSAGFNESLANLKALIEGRKIPYA